MRWAAVYHTDIDEQVRQTRRVVWDTQETDALVDSSDATRVMG